MTEENNLKIKNFDQGMFQYVIIFDKHMTNQTETKKLFFELNCGRKTTILTENRSNQNTNPTSEIQKKVRIVDKLNIKILYVWSFAHKQARKDIWQQIARDRSRFKERINNYDSIISPILKNKNQKYMVHPQ